jgi:phage terminase Nu1 subunit (DNA packaging protein)
MAKTERRIVSTIELSEIIGLTDRRVRQLARAGSIPRHTRGRYDLIDAVRGYIAYLKERALEVEIDGESHEQSKARLTRARADIQERASLQMAGILIPLDQIELSWSTVIAMIRQRLIALPDRVAPEVHDAESVNDTKEKLRLAIYEILTELSETPIEYREPDTALNGTPRVAGGGEVNASKDAPAAEA